MKEICGNCEYYVRISFSSNEYSWGDCRKPVISNSSKESKSVFKWSDGTCGRFEPKQKAKISR